MNADGSGERRLTTNRRDDSFPAWSSDGRKIAFVSNVEIHVMNADGSGLRKLTRNVGYNAGPPAWSPDGSKIAFLDADAVDVMNADGSGHRRLALYSGVLSAIAPAWSPDGRKMAFTGTTSSTHFDIYVVNADGSGLRNLTQQPGDDIAPVWSPAHK